MSRVIFFIAFASAICLAQHPPLPAPPRVLIDSTYEVPSGPRIAVKPGDNLQKVLDEAAYNSTIVLESGGVYNGNFQIKPKTWNGGWIYIVSGNFLNSPVPPQPGQRVTPNDARYMARLVTSTMNPAMLIERKQSTPAASHIRFVGVEFTSASQANANPNNQPWPINGMTASLLALTGAESITVDRCYMHGSLTVDVQRGVIAVQGVRSLAVIDSDIDEIHSGGGSEAQAILVTSSEGPFKIVNNKLSASTEDVMFGGAGVNLPEPYNGYVPADIEIKYNWFWKDEAWVPRTTGAKPWQWVEKNNLEFKTGARILVLSNTLENAWNSGQYGSNILITPRSYQSGPNTVANDIDIQGNMMLNSNWAFSILGKDDLCQPPQCTNQSESVRVRIAFNQIRLRAPSAPASYQPRGFSLGRAMRDYYIYGNTIVVADGSPPFAAFYFNQGKCPEITDPPVNMFIVNNVAQQITGDCGYTGQRALDMFMPEPAPSSQRYWGNLKP